MPVTVLRETSRSLSIDPKVIGEGLPEVSILESVGYLRSRVMANPMPPPIQRVAKPFCKSLRFISMAKA